MFSWEEGLKAIVAIAFRFVTFLHTGLFTGSSVKFAPAYSALCGWLKPTSSDSVDFHEYWMSQSTHSNEKAVIVTQLQTWNHCLQFWPDQDSTLRRIPWDRSYFSQWTTNDSTAVPGNKVSRVKKAQVELELRWTTAGLQGQTGMSGSQRTVINWRNRDKHEDQQHKVPRAGMSRKET